MKDIKIFTPYVEQSARSIIESVSSSPYMADNKIRIMPDVHAGDGIVIGFTCLASNYINPDHIGSDIGCGIEMILFDKILEEKDYPIFEQRIRNAIPMGKELTKKTEFDMKDFCKFMRNEINKASQSSSGKVKIIPFGNEKDIKNWRRSINLEEKDFYKSLGTLGGGNHFIELDKDEDHIGITVHTGSRILGQKVWSKWSKFASKYCGYLSGDNLSGYLTDMVIAQAYAKYNRRIILEKISEIYRKLCKGEVTELITSVHNYLDFDDMIIRKGAIRSYQGEKMIIPFNMRDGLIVCEGKSNPDWNNSAPHGSGRCMSRSKAKSSITLDDFQNSMKGIYSTSVTLRNIDESPMAYKTSSEIIEYIEPTCKILYLMKPVINIKA